MINGNAILIASVASSSDAQQQQMIKDAETAQVAANEQATAVAQEQAELARYAAAMNGQTGDALQAAEYAYQAASTRDQTVVNAASANTDACGNQVSSDSTSMQQRVATLGQAVYSLMSALSNMLGNLLNR